MSSEWSDQAQDAVAEATRIVSRTLAHHAEVSSLFGEAVSLLLEAKHLLADDPRPECAEWIATVHDWSGAAQAAIKELP
jgi:hypothetical protein